MLTGVILESRDISAKCGCLNAAVTPAQYVRVIIVGKYREEYGKWDTSVINVKF